MSAFGQCCNLGSVLLCVVINPRLARLVRATSRRHDVLRFGSTRTFGTDGDPSFLSQVPRFARRPLSPLERVSQMLPQESLSEEVQDLRDPRPKQDGEETRDVEGQDLQNLEDAGSTCQTEQEEGTPLSGALPSERKLRFGEILLAEYQRKRRLEFQKMFQLVRGSKLMSNQGVIAHEAVEGCHPGTILRTSQGLPILIRRPSLEEFTLFMKRGPAIAYPKDASAMLMMMDVNEGDAVLESGSGSGAMSLFLSRAVGSKGCVLSAEVRPDHHRRAVLNYERWRAAWRLRTGDEWPDNVKFHLADLIESAPLLAGRGFHSIALDMINPHLALPTVVPHLNTGGVCAVYQANITQIIDLMEGLRCSDLPLVCERIMEVQCRDWLLAPSLKKDGTFHRRRAPGDGKEAHEEDGDENADESEEADTPKTFPFGSVPYIARPHPEQTGHTAFLVKLRKISR